MKISIWWNAIKIFTEKFFQAWLETLRFLTFAFPSKYLYRNFSSRSQIHLILRNVVQVSDHKVTNKPIPELTQTSRERHCTFCHFHFLSRDRPNKLFTEINIAFYVTFTFWKEIKFVLSLSTKDHHIALALHWRHSNFCSLARPDYQSFEIGKATLIGFWLIGLRKLSKRKDGIGSKKTLDHISKIWF